jgi:diacylglycerol kinase (ATP)
MKGLIIYNPAAGQRDRAEEVAQAAELLTQAGWEVLGVVPTGAPGDATMHARSAVAQACDVIFVAGGDGTAAQVADGLVGTETALGVLPGGTGNVLARQLNLPVPGGLRTRPLLDALALLLQGQVRQVDLGRVSLAGGIVRHFLCWSGVGFDAQVTKTVDSERERKQRLGLAAFAIAALLTLRDYGGTRAVIRADGRRTRKRLIMLLASNIQLYGAWFRMAPQAVLDDGWLDVYAFHGRHPLRTFGRALGLLVNRRLEIPEVKDYRARRIEIITGRPLPVHVDGDTIGYTPALIEVVPGALKLLVPNSAPASLFQSGVVGTSPETVVDWVARLARDAQNTFWGRNNAA